MTSISGNIFQNVFKFENRIDLLIGLIYNEYYCKKYKTNFHKNLYLAYKKSWNNLKENNFESEDDFIKRFENIINSTIKTKKNIEKIPIIKFCFKNNFVEYWIFDGFHRVSTCLYHNINFDIVIKKVINLKNTYPLEKNQWWKNYWYPLNINFFQNKNSQNYEVLDSKYIDYIIYYYLKNIIKNFLVIVSYEGNISEHLKDFNILFSKKITSKSNKFKKNFIELLYYNDEWPSKCYVEKSKNCFKSDNLIIYFIENMDISILKKKKNILEIFLIENIIQFIQLIIQKNQMI